MAGQASGVPTPAIIHSMSRWMGNYTLRATQASYGAPGAAAWPVANLAIYIPLTIPWYYECKRLFWVNGSTAGGNSDIGIYNEEGTRIISSGTTVNAGAGLPQYVTATILLNPGQYYVGYVMSITTASRVHAFTIASAAKARQAGYLQETLGANTLPATMTPVAFAQTVIELCGLTRYSTGF